MEEFIDYIELPVGAVVDAEKKMFACGEGVEGCVAAELAIYNEWVKSCLTAGFDVSDAVRSRIIDLGVNVLM